MFQLQRAGGPGCFQRAVIHAGQHKPPAATRRAQRRNRVDTGIVRGEQAVMFDEDRVLPCVAGLVQPCPVASAAQQSERDVVPVLCDGEQPRGCEPGFRQAAEMRPTAEESGVRAGFQRLPALREDCEIACRRERNSLQAARSYR